MNVDGYNMQINVRGPREGAERLIIALGMGMAALTFVCGVGQPDEWERFAAFCDEQKPGTSSGLDRLQAVGDARVLADVSTGLADHLDQAPPEANLGLDEV